MSKKNKQEDQGVLENPEVLADKITKTEEFFEKNKKLVYGAAGLVILVAAIIFGYRYYINGQNQEAQDEMFRAVFYFESDSLEKALNGDGINYGLLDIVDQYGGTKAANLANFYAGAAFLKQGEYESAIEYLSNFSAGDYLIQSRAYSLIGDAHMELGEYQQASELYTKAANHRENEEFSPKYLMKAAIAYELDNDLESARDCYQTIIDQYSSTVRLPNVKKEHARLTAMIGK